ncbi:hypothetical protein QBE52_14470 [Clostridiaceae bacterium 35-E11]
MKFDALQHNYPSRRNVVLAQKGMVATSQPLAAQAWKSPGHAKTLKMIAETIESILSVRKDTLYL